MTITNETRRRIMSVAWDLFRTDRNRTFADALRGAWKFIRGLTKAVAAFRSRARGARHIMFSRSLIRSPNQRATSTQRYAGAADGHAARITSRLGV
jgi:hypothetical protein